MPDEYINAVTLEQPGFPPGFANRMQPSPERGRSCSMNTNQEKLTKSHRTGT